MCFRPYFFEVGDGQKLGRKTGASGVAPFNATPLAVAD